MSDPAIIRLITVRDGIVINIKDNVPEGDPILATRVQYDVEFFPERDPDVVIEIGDPYNVYIGRARNSFAAEPTLWEITRELANQIRANMEPAQDPFDDLEWFTFVVDLITAKQPISIPVPIVPGWSVLKTGDVHLEGAVTVAGVGGSTAAAVGTASASGRQIAYSPVKAKRFNLLVVGSRRFKI